MKSQVSPTILQQYRSQLIIELLVVAILLALLCLFLPQLKAASLTVKIMVAMVVVFWIMRAALTLNKLIDGFKEKFVRR